VSTEDFDFSASGHNLANNYRHEHEVLVGVITLQGQVFFTLPHVYGNKQGSSQSTSIRSLKQASHQDRLHRAAFHE
jgi:hypothetical protein